MKDYEKAREDAEKLFNETGIICAIGKPSGDVKDEWPNILYNVLFTYKTLTIKAEYRLGVGHIDWKKAGKESSSASGFNYGFTSDNVCVLNTLSRNPGATLKDKKLWAKTAAKIALVQKVAPKSFEVFASYCRDAMDAHGQSFADYAENFGMSADSIKAKATYDFCAELYHQLARIISPKLIAEFSELANQF